MNRTLKNLISLSVLLLCFAGISEARLSNTFDYTDGLLTSTSTPEGVTTFEYGCSRLLSKATKGTESIAYIYDGSLLKTDTRTGLLTQSINYAYNNDFRLSSLTYAGASYSLLYDNDGLLTKVGNFTITRSASNGLPIMASDGVLSLSKGFNGYGEVESNAYKIGATDVYTLSMIRDNSGRITQKVENIKGEVITWDYSYDNLGRLVEVKKNGTVIESYTYDGNGNRLTDSSRSYSYSTEDHVITAGTDSYQFNVDGFLTSKTTSAGTTTYNYSSRGELLSVTKPDSTVITYDNDPFGRRIAKRINGTITEKYLWKNRITLLAVYDGNNNLISRFNYADGRLPASMTYAGSIYYLTYDQVGSLRVVTDINGNVVKRIDYDSFGNVALDTNPTFSIPFGFAGGLYDRDTRLVRFGLRDYDPSIGRWTAKDPIDFAGGDTNLFSYISSDPLNWIDPFGLDRLTFDGTTVSWVNDQDQVISTYGATSGPFGNGALPEGNYTGRNLRQRTNRAMTCEDGTGWSLDLDPNFQTDRTLLRIHPDGNVAGTEGCIGISCTDADQLYDDLNDYFNSGNTTISVDVEY